MSITLNIGQKAELSVPFFDQAGQLLLVAPKLDGAPVWTNRTPSILTLTPSDDGLTASALALTVGNDTIHVTLSVGGVVFNDDFVVSVIPDPQLTRIKILAVHGPVPGPDRPAVPVSVPAPTPGFFPVPGPAPSPAPSLVARPAPVLP